MILSLAIGLALQGGIEGSVCARDGSPVAGARVILGELGHATLFYNAPDEMFVGTPGLSENETKRFSALIFSDEQGRFSAEGLEAGEYSLIAADPARGIAYATLVLRKDAPLAARLVLQPPAFVVGSVEGQAFDPQLNVLELKPREVTANISMIPRLLQQPGSWSFRSVALPATRGWRLVGTQVVLEQDFRATLFSVPVDAPPGEETRLAVDLGGGGEVRGRVLDARGAAARFVSVVAMSSSSPSFEIGALTDADGRYRIRGLSDGNWRLDGLRFGMRDVPGCGNGPQELFGSQTFRVTGQAAGEIDLRMSASRAPPAIGELAPDFMVATIDGAELKLSSLRGRVVLLDFWATWCGMCRAEFPRLLDTYESHSPSARFEIVGISLDEDVGLVRRFIASRGLRWPQTALGLPAKNPLTQLYNVNSTPSTVLIGADGKVVALNLTGDPLRKKLDELLATK